VIRKAKPFIYVIFFALISVVFFSFMCHKKVTLLCFGLYLCLFILYLVLGLLEFTEAEMILQTKGFGNTAKVD
jgi:hypothetical protein